MRSLEFSFLYISPSRLKPRRREKNKLNVYFQTSLWCLKRLHEGLKGLKPYEAPHRSVKIKI